MEEEKENITEEKPVEESSDVKESKETSEEVSNLVENKEEKPKDDYFKIKKSTLRNAVIFLGIVAVILIAIFVYPKFSGPTGAVVGVDNETVDTTQSKGVKLTVLNDKRCNDCNAGGTISQLRGIIPNLDIKEVDYNTKEGKELYGIVGDNLPAFLFDDSVTKSEGYQQIQNYLVKKGDYFSLRVGSKHDPEAEICDNKVDDTGNGKIDCEDDDCSSKLVCNKDAFAECASSYDITPETVVFYYSNSCGWCTKMKPGVTQLQEEGYEFKWVEAGNAEEEQVVNECFRDYMSGGIPQFICPKTTDIKSGAFTDADRNLDVDAMRKFADECIAG